MSFAALAIMGAFVGSAKAETIVYNFDDLDGIAGNLTDAATSNDFGSGVIASDIVAGGTTKLGDVGESGWDSVHEADLASIKLGEVAGTLSWDVIIPDGVTIDLTSLAFEFDYRSTNPSGNANVRQEWTLTTSVGSGNPGTNAITGIENGVQLIEQNETVTLLGLSALTGTTVTFTISFDSGIDDTLEGGNATNRRTVIDSIVLTGSTTVPSANTFAAWIANFDVGGLNGFNDDPDGDEIPNGVENFLGTNPSAFSQGLASGAVSSGTFTFTHLQGDLAIDLTAAYRWSKDLLAFSPDGSTDGDGTKVEFAVQLNTPLPGTTTVTASVTGTPTDKLFVDVEVMQN